MTHDWRYCESCGEYVGVVSPTWGYNLCRTCGAVVGAVVIALTRDRKGRKS